MQVYEDLTYDAVEHRSLASFPGMRERTVVTSSLSKTFSVTGKVAPHEKDIISVTKAVTETVVALYGRFCKASKKRGCQSFVLSE